VHLPPPGPTRSGRVPATISSASDGFQCATPLQALPWCGAPTLVRWVAEKPILLSKKKNACCLPLRATLHQGAGL